MLRISRYLRAIHSGETVRPIAHKRAPVVIWNLIRRCNLACKHCYSVSADHNFPGELSTQQALSVLNDLHNFGVKVLILSGGEPLLRPDIFDIAARARDLGFYTALSTNGTLIDESLADRIAEMNFDYVGISLDGIGEVHDRFRRVAGAYDKALTALRHLKARNVKTGLRFTITDDNAHHFPAVLDLMREEAIDKFYLSHLNYGGRGNRNRKDDVVHQRARAAVIELFERAWQDIEAGHYTDYVTGNNDADAVLLWQWVKKRWPDKAERLFAMLEAWGGNAAGVGIANIDNLGNVHPDTFWWGYTLGNVKERPFSEIWQDESDPLLRGLRQRPRPLKGRCAECRWLSICGGNARIRAYQLTGDPWQEDPACYLDDEEIGITTPVQRIEVQPYSRRTDPFWHSTHRNEVRRQ